MDKSKKIDNKNKTNSFNKNETKYEEKKAIKLKNQYFLILSMNIFSFIVLIFAFFSLIGIITYSYSNGVLFSEGTYIGIIVLLGFSIIGLMISLIFLHKIKKDIKIIKVKLIEKDIDPSDIQNN